MINEDTFIELEREKSIASHCLHVGSSYGVGLHQENVHEDPQPTRLQETERNKIVQAKDKELAQAQQQLRQQVTIIFTLSLWTVVTRQASMWTH